MPKKQMQKQKILFILKYLYSETDENHPASAAKLIEMLERAGICAERKSVYSDIEALTQFGLDIVKRPGAGGGWYLASRHFELPELKLLVDSVQSAKFITHKKTNQLITKLESLAAKHEASALRRQVFITNRVKNDNESIYYNVDRLHTAMTDDRNIVFKYFEWTPEKKKQLRNEGRSYTVSPWALTWDDENYYLVGYDTAAKKIKHFRVDKMTAIEQTETARSGREEAGSLDIAEYSKRSFGMFGGRECRVTLKCENRFAGVIIDRFGAEVDMIPQGETFLASAEVMVSPMFYSWIMNFGPGMEILSPDWAKEELKALIAELYRHYFKEHKDGA